MAEISVFHNESETESYQPGQVIFHRGDTGRAMFGVIEGVVEIGIDGSALEEVGPGGIFGELSLIDQGPRSADAVAKTACRVVRIDERRFTFLIQQTPFFAIQVMEIMADRLRRQTRSS
jgi:CRP-like cAMP-binding protein